VISTTPKRARTSSDDHVLITGGAGFIGSNLANHLLGKGARVRILDSLARRGAHFNAQWLCERYPETVEIMVGDVRDRAAVNAAVADVRQVFHLAAQVAVTTSLIDPQEDFSVNAQGTLNVLEALRQSKRPPSLIFSSTNKVYGGLSDLPMLEQGDRYVPANEQVRALGISETRPLEFHSPYGCSKGAADQYVRDYARSYGLDTVVLRMSCIYGPRQFGNEDQGWVAHFVRCALSERAITIYGNGLQVRDVLFIDDFVQALELAYRNIQNLRGAAFNIGGGVDSVVSIRELLKILQEQMGLDIEFACRDWRVGDQKYYVSDIERFRAATGWSPTTCLDAGLAALTAWLAQLEELEHLPQMHAVKGADLSPRAREIRS
jgi:CDP-paratose 2-epimerase